LTKANKVKLIKRILLGLFFAVGTAIIILAAMVVKNVFFAEKIDTRVLTDNFEDYMTVYEEYPSMRDLPEGLEVVSSRCEIKDKVFTYTLKIRNTSPAMREYALQLYYSEELMELKPKARNPFIREYSDEGLLILSDETKEFTITGTIGSDTDMDEFKAAMSYVYLEVICSDTPGRVMLPVKIVES